MARMIQASQTFSKEKAPGVDAPKGFEFVLHIERLCLEPSYPTHHDIDRRRNEQHRVFVARYATGIKSAVVRFCRQSLPDAMIHTRIKRHGKPPPAN